MSQFIVEGSFAWTLYAMVLRKREMMFHKLPFDVVHAHHPCTKRTATGVEYGVWRIAESQLSNNCIVIRGKGGKQEDGSRVVEGLLSNSFAYHKSNAPFFPKREDTQKTPHLSYVA